MRATLPVLGLAALAVAAPAAGAGLAGFGSSYLHPTFCTYESTLVGAEVVPGEWVFVLTLAPHFTLCAVGPVHVFSGPWDPEAGGCGPADWEYRLCLDPVPLGAGSYVQWRTCPAFVECAEEATAFAGTLLAARA